jgi:anti-sigma factor RsiW
MNCKEFRELLDLYVDGELSPERMVAAGAHLAECVTCTRTRDELVRLQVIVKKVVAQHAPPPQLVSQVNLLFGQKGSVRRREQDAVGPASESNLVSSPSGGLSGLLARRVAIPLPVLAVAVLVFIALGCWAFASFDRGTATRTLGSSNVNSINPPLSPQPADTMDLSRFDHGRRATVVKVRRDSTLSNAY